MMDSLTVTIFLVLHFVAVSKNVAFLTRADKRKLNSIFHNKTLEHLEIVQQIMIPKTNKFFRTKRQSENDIFIMFEAFNTSFSLRLFPNQVHSKFSKYIKTNLINVDNVTYTTVPHAQLYKGELLEGKSKARGIIKNGTFLGTIKTREETYYLESMKRYLDEHDERIFIYKASDLSPAEMQDQVHCAQVELPRQDKTSNFTGKKSTKKSKRANKLPMGKYCSLHMIADYTYFQAVGRSSVSLVTEEFEIILDDASDIYSTTDFTFDGVADGITFRLAEVTIFTTASKGSFNSEKGYRSHSYYLYAARRACRDGFKGKTIDCDKVCEAAFFTHTSFGGVLGVTWGAAGICSGDGSNIVVVSSLSYGRTRSIVQLSNTFSHELGHAFGSSHDPVNDPECTPMNRFGYFLMSTYVDDFAQNHNKRLFSKCSREMIAARIIRRPYCLMQKITPICGNQIRENGEECDCGTSKVCANIDPCCIPSDSPNGCKLDRSKGKTCTPLYSPCCEKTCKVTPANDKRLCKVKSECTLSSVCDGKSPTCPKPKPSSNKYCQQKTTLCVNGMCKKSICSLIGRMRCQCSNKKEACKLCCKSSMFDRCVPFSPPESIQKDFKFPPELPFGSPCLNNKGFCDKKNICISADIKRVLLYQDDPEGQYERVEDLWYFIVTSISFAIIGTFIVSRYFSKEKGTVSEKVMLGLKKEARAHLLVFQLQRTLLTVNFTKIEKTLLDPVTISVERLKKLFTTTSSEIILQFAAESNDEKNAVYRLIRFGEPVRKRVSIRDIDNKCHAQECSV